MSGGHLRGTVPWLYNFLVYATQLDFSGAGLSKPTKSFIATSNRLKLCEVEQGAVGTARATHPTTTLGNRCCGATLVALSMLRLCCENFERRSTLP
jgi:hypothetical protein